MRQLTLDGRSLTLVHLKAVLAGEPVQLAIAKPAMAAVKRARAIVEAHVKNGDVVYGLTTGFGKLKSVAIAKEDLAQLQENLVLSHCVGVGEPLPPNIVRAAQVLRLNGLVRGHSGVSTTLVEHLVTCFNAGFVPVVPSQGSVGASGDLAPLAHMAAAYLGHGDCTVGGVRMKAALGLKKPSCWVPKRVSPSSTAPRSSKPSAPKRSCAPRRSWQAATSWRPSHWKPCLVR